MNKVIITGYVSNSYETKVKGEKTAKTFRVAVNYDYKSSKEVTADFFKCVIFNQNVKFYDSYIEVGDRISIVGRLKNNNYTKSDGTNVYENVINVEQLELLCKKKVEKNKKDTDSDSDSDSDSSFYDDFFADFNDEQTGSNK